MASELQELGLKLGQVPPQLRWHRLLPVFTSLECSPWAGTKGALVNEGWFFPVMFCFNKGCRILFWECECQLCLHQGQGGGGREGSPSFQCTHSLSLAAAPNTPFLAGTHQCCTRPTWNVLPSCVEAAQAASGVPFLGDTQGCPAVALRSCWWPCLASTSSGPCPPQAAAAAVSYPRARRVGAESSC